MRARSRLLVCAVLSGAISVGPAADAPPPRLESAAGRALAASAAFADGPDSEHAPPPAAPPPTSAPRSSPPAADRRAAMRRREEEARVKAARFYASLVTIESEGIQVLHAPGEAQARSARSLLARRVAFTRRVSARLRQLAGTRPPASPVRFVLFPTLESKVESAGASDEGG